MKITGEQITAARALLRWTGKDLSDRAQVARSSLQRIETGAEKVNASTMNSVVRVLEAAGIEFLPNGLVLNSDGSELPEESSA